MCLYVMKENAEPGEIIECEQPGFSSAKLVSVPEGTAEIGELETERLRFFLNGVETDNALELSILSGDRLRVAYGD